MLLNKKRIKIISFTLIFITIFTFSVVLAVEEDSVYVWASESEAINSITGTFESETTSASETTSTEITEEKNLSTEIFPISPQRIADLTEKKVSSKINNNILPKVNAIIGLLDKFGLLDELTEGTRKELFEALIKIVSYDE